MKRLNKNLYKYFHEVPPKNIKEDGDSNKNVKNFLKFGKTRC